MKNKNIWSLSIWIYGLSVLISIAVFTNTSNAQINFDGVNCNTSPNVDGTTWEWDPADAFVDVDDTTQSIPGSSDIESVWSSVEGQYLIFAFSRAAASTGGAGNAGFKFHFNTDCDPTTGDTDFDGADAALFFSIQSGEVQDSNIYVWSGNNYSTSGDQFSALIGGSSCVDSADRHFFELKVHISKIYNLCSGYSCGGITLTAATAHAGGSFSSIIKDTLVLNVDIFINDPPVIDLVYSPDEICSGETVTLDASASTENYTINTPYDSIVSFEWDMSYNAADGFIPNSSYTESILELEYYGTTVNNIALRTTDVFGCQDTVDDITIKSYSYPIVILDQNFVDQPDTCRDLMYNGSYSIGYNATATLSYFWELPDGTTSTLESFTKTYTNCIWSYADFVKLTVTDDKGCASIMSAAPPLPIVLLSFDGKIENGFAELTWHTASEINNSHFYIERSNNGHEFYKIGRLEGALNSITTLTYNFLDPIKISKSAYYKLVQVDVDGQETSYGPIALNGIESTKELVVYPNPSYNNITVVPNFDQQHFEVKLINPYGSVLIHNHYTNSEDQASLEIDLSLIRTGLYYLSVGNNIIGYEYRVIEVLK
jgi:hypothetical protein